MIPFLVRIKVPLFTADIPESAYVATVVLIAGLLVGLRLTSDEGSEGERRAVAAKGRRDDLEARRDSIVAALKALEQEKGKLSPAEYDQERSKLVKQGADAMRLLDTDPASEQEDTLARETLLSEDFTKALESERTRLGGDMLRLAIADHLGMAAEPTAPTRGIAAEWKGALWAVLGMALAVGLVLVMQQNVGERGQDGPMTGRGAGAQAQQPGGMSAAAQESKEEARLKARLAENPQDLEALNGLTQLAFVKEDMGSAMQWNKKALAVDETDLTARTYKGVMRWSVGMLDPALAIIDEVLAEDPTFRTALFYKGMIAFDARKYDESADALEKALDGAPPNPFLQRRLADAKRLAAGGSPGPAAPAGNQVPRAPETIITGTITLAPGAVAPPGSQIFVSVRNPAGGPPLGAKKLPPGPFPMTFTVTTADAISMGGPARPFPQTLLLKVKVDTDGNAMTTEPGAPKIEQTASKGATDLVFELAP